MPIANDANNRRRSLPNQHQSKPGHSTSGEFVSRAGNKLADAAVAFGIDFRGKVVLDIGSSTGGFTDFALKHGAKKVIAVEKGTDQMDSRLRNDKRVELYEKTDIFDFSLCNYHATNGAKRSDTPVQISRQAGASEYNTTYPDLILADVSFLSLTKILKYARMELAGLNTALLVMLKPQFEAKPYQLVDGIVKNSKIRREIIKNFENQIKSDFKIIAKQDNSVAGRYGNVERFYLLKVIK